MNACSWRHAAVAVATLATTCTLTVTAAPALSAVRPSAAVGSYSPTCAHAPKPLPAGATLSVDGNHLVAEGKPFVVHGVIIEGLQDSQAELAKGTSTDNGQTVSLKVVAEARKAWGPAELYAIRCYGANTVRIHVGQPSADPKNKEFSPSYLKEFVSAVKLARRNGLAVIVDMQDEPLSGEHHSDGNPTAATLRAWRELAPMLANIPGVMLELFNEPTLKATASGAWNTWKNGGPAPAPQGRTAMTVGTQTLVNAIRALPAKPRNPIVVMGLLAGNGQGGWTLHGMPQLTDPVNGPSQLVFSVHFPPTNDSVSTDQPTWKTEFGNTAASLPVMVGAFNVSSNSHCSADAPATATDLVTRYLTSIGVGIAAWAFDYPQSIFTGPGATGSLTNFTNFSCEGAGYSGTFGGDGQLFYSAFTAEGNGT
jgi:hypothetical protein